MIKNLFKSPQFINCRGKLLDLSEPKVMGIINITPDSFYHKSRFIAQDEIHQRVEDIITQGGHIVDIGAYSSRPGAEHIDDTLEWNRLAPVLESVRKNFPDVIISVDTFRSQIAQKVVNEFEVDMINDISAGSMDENLFDTIADINVPYILMHMQGTPQNMQLDPDYEHLLKDVFLFFAQKIEKLKTAGVSDILIDPGFGFGKTLDQNFELLAKLDEFRIFELPLLVGLSRKSMIYKYLDFTPNEALNGTTVLNTVALSKGANILRVHDVKEASEAVSLFQKLKSVTA